MLSHSEQSARRWGTIQYTLILFTLLPTVSYSFWLVECVFAFFDRIGMDWITVPNIPSFSVEVFMVFIHISGSIPSILALVHSAQHFNTGFPSTTPTIVAKFHNIPRFLLLKRQSYHASDSLSQYFSHIISQTFFRPVRFWIFPTGRK